jgi:hypothetical protein
LFLKLALLIAAGVTAVAFFWLDNRPLARFAFRFRWHFSLRFFRYFGAAQTIGRVFTSARLAPVSHSTAPKIYFARSERSHPETGGVSLIKPIAGRGRTSGSRAANRISAGRLFHNFDLPSRYGTITEHAHALIIQGMPFPAGVGCLEYREFFFWGQV